MKERVVWLDQIRVLAIVAVVFNHATEIYLGLNGGEWAGYDAASRILASVGFSFGRLGVPLFLFLTGALTLSKAVNTDEDVFRFYRHSLLPLATTVVAWNVLLTLFDQCTRGGGLALGQIIRCALFLESVPALHAWYAPMIVGMYVFLPFVAAVVRRFSLKALALPLAIAATAFLVLPTLMVIDPPQKRQLTLGLDFAGGEYGVYMLAGYYLYQGNLEKRVSKPLAAVACAVAFAALAALQMRVAAVGEGGLRYTNLGLLLCASVLFLAFKRFGGVPRPSVRRLLTALSRLSFGVYFLHVPVQWLLRRYMPQLFHLGPAGDTLLLFSLSLVLSACVLWLAGRLKCLRRLLLNQKD